MTTSTRSTRDWQQADSQHFLHPFTDHKSLSEKGSRIITREKASLRMRRIRRAGN